MRRLDGRPKKHWKWSKDQLLHHRNATYLGLDQSRLQAFKGAHNRVRDGKCPSIQWSRTRAGYIAFCKAIGPIPKNMRKPSVGRKNHAKGYIKGNMNWEEHTHNSIKRKGTRYENQAY